MIRRFWMGLALICTLPLAHAADRNGLVGEVVTNEKLMGPNDTVGVMRFEDPKVPGAFCYLASAQTGGFAANFGMADSPSEYELSCFTVGDVHLPANLADKEVIESVARSAIFKVMYVARFVDRETHRLVYVAYTRKLWDGSPKHAMSSLAYTP